MVFPESQYDRFIALSKEKSIVCFGAGRLLKQYVEYLHECGMDEKLIAIVDNDERKQGQIKEICGVHYSIQSFESLIDMNRHKDFFILVTSSFYLDMTEQVRAHSELKDIEVLDMAKVMEERTHHLACYTEIFRNMGVGVNGENLTISILMHNRAALTLKLIESIDENLINYQGRVIIGNNCSDDDEINLIRGKLKQLSFDYEIFDFEQHYSIPKGKNLLNREADTEWILQLDNDIYFTDNPIAKINEDISELGCSLWGLPYYDTGAKRVANFGSNLKFVKTCDNAERLDCLYDLHFDIKERLWSPMFCTYAAGCAFFFRKELFLNSGEYDENLFMFEDIDLMYRLNRKGYKIGNIGMKCLVHDHQEIDSELGREYEKIRFDKDRVQRSKVYFKKKYGFEV